MKEATRALSLTRGNGSPPHSLCCQGLSALIPLIVILISFQEEKRPGAHTRALDQTSGVTHFYSRSNKLTPTYIYTNVHFKTHCHIHTVDADARTDESQ